jgi:phenylpropionate dioxygenase-like ring-hydroxylating dioxygenase large terminal subunit
LLHFEAAITDMLENLVDPAHTTFVHRNTIGGGDASDVQLEVSQENNMVKVGRWIEDSAPVPVMQRYGRFRGQIDRWQYYYLFAPNVSLVDMGGIDAGTERTPLNMNATYRTLSYAVLTPETENSTHYFWFVLRSFAADDEAVSGEMRHAYVETFDEDRALLAAVQRNKQRATGSTPLRLGIDNATIRLRRLLERTLAEETSVDATQHAKVEQ